MFELRKWEPLKELTQLQREMDDFFKRTLSSITPSAFFRGEWLPAIDCYMKENQFVVHADLPGVEPGKLDVSVTGNLLTIKGERSSERDIGKESYMLHEASYGSFERTVTLPEGADTSNVRASYKNGILDLTMPVKAEALPRKVKIELGEVEKTKKAA